MDEPEVEEVIRRITQVCTTEEICEFLIIYSKKSSDDYLKFLQTLNNMFEGYIVRCLTEQYPGVGGALYTGFQNASGSHVVTIASDLENDPYDVRTMIDLSKENPDHIITASRQLRKSDFGDYPKIKKLFNNGFRLFLKIFLHVHQTDPTYLFQCTPKNVFLSHNFSLNRDAFVLEMALIPETENIPFTEFPSEITMRKNGESHSSFKYYFHFLKYAVSTISNKVIK